MVGIHHALTQVRSLRTRLSKADPAMEPAELAATIIVLCTNLELTLNGLAEIDRLPTQRGMSNHARPMTGVSHSSIISIMTRVAQQLRKLPAP